MKPVIDYTLYLVTDRDLMSTETLEQAVEAACAGGVTLVQLREKHASRSEFVDLARRVKRVCDKHDIPLIINDEPDIAVEIGAAGVHVGQEDLEASRVREIVGPDAIVGVSAATVAEAQAAQRAGADYLGVGAVFPTSTKPDADFIPRETLTAICAAVSIPVVAIGGIGADNLLSLAGTGIDGVAVVSAIFAQPDVQRATERLLILTKELVKR